MGVTPTVAAMVGSYLLKHGYDGLLEDHNECACDLSDLMPCDEADVGSCQAGWKIPCDPERCGLDGDCDWHISVIEEETDVE
jgi:hypothetical protein